MRELSFSLLWNSISCCYLSTATRETWTISCSIFCLLKHYLTNSIFIIIIIGVVLFGFFCFMNNFIFAFSSPCRSVSSSTNKKRANTQYSYKTLKQYLTCFNKSVKRNVYFYAFTWSADNSLKYNKRSGWLKLRFLIFNNWKCLKKRMEEP